MFYAHFVLAKKGPLARIWLAAHWDKKLTKAHVFETNIEKSVDGILQPKVKMALRTSGHLLLGVVRIYSRKAKYLLADCNEAFVKIKMAFRPGMVDLPDDIREAAVSAITLPEVFHDFDTTMPELNDVDIQAQFTLNQSRAEEITMREDYGNISLVTGDDGFGDMGFEEPPDIMRDASAMDQSLDHPNMIFNPDGTEVKEDEDEMPIKHQDSRLEQVHGNTSALDLEAPIRDDGFGGHLGQDIMAGGLFEGGLFDDTPMVIGEGPSLHERTHFPENEVKDEEDSDDDGGALDQFGGPPSVGPPSSPEGGGSRPGTPTKPAKAKDEEQQPPELEFPEEAEDEGFVLERFDPPEEEEEEIAPRRSGRATKPQKGSLNEENIEGGAKASTGETPTQADESLAMADQTTLLHNEEESFALAPVDTSAIKSGWPRTKRKRKLIVDEVKNISGEEMKAQLSDTTDIVTTLDLAPPTKRLMHWKETGGVEKLFALPGRVIHARPLGKLYVRHLTSESVQNEDFGMAGDTELENLSLEQVRDYDEAPETPAVPKQRGRPKRKRDDEEEQEQEEVVSKETRNRRGGAEPETEFAEPPTPATPAPPTPMHAPDTPAPPTPGPFTPAPLTPAPATPGPPTPAHPGLDEAPQQDFFPPPQTPTLEVGMADMQPPTPGGASSVAPSTDYQRTPQSAFGDSHDMQNFQTPEHFQTPAHDSGHGAHQTPAHNPIQGAHVHDPTFAEIQKFPDFEPPKIDDEQNGGEGGGGEGVELQNDENITNNADTSVGDRGADTSVGDIPNDAGTAEDHNLEQQLEQFDNMGFIENAGGDAPANTSYEESSHPPATTPGALSDGGPKSVYAEAPHSPPPATPAPQTPGPQPADHQEDEGEMPTEEEQAEDETYEEYEERVVNKRAGLMFHQIKKKLRTDVIDFGKMVHGHNRKAVAQKFYTMLVLKKLQAVELDQADPFGELFIRRGTLFENASL